MAEKNKIQKYKKTNCNCICCKFCNDNWTEYKPRKQTIEEQFQIDKIKHKKKLLL